MISFLKKRRSRRIGIVFSVFLLLLLSRLVAFLTLRYDDEHWDSVLEEKCSQYLAAAEGAFSGLQRITRRVATEAGQNAVVTGYLSGKQTNRVSLFSEVSQLSRDEGVGIEVYDRDGNLVAWGGNSGPGHRREVRIALDGQMTSYVTHSPISSQLFVATPVRNEGRITGVVLVRRTIEVDYPFNNRFLNRQGLAEKMAQDLGVNVEFDFGPNAELSKDGRYASKVLYGIDSARVGVVSVLRPARSAYLEGIAVRFEVLNACLWTILIGFAAFVLGRITFGLSSPFLRGAGLTIIIWLTRYAFLWIDVPSSLVSSGIFDPAHFASEFGGGLAKSIGEMTLTVFALTLNVALLAHLVLVRRSGVRRPVRMPIAAGFSVSAVLCGLMYWLLRGYGAVIRSAVFDSTLSYNDPRVILPPFELGMMMFSLFLLSFCIVAVAVGVTAAMTALMSPGRNQAPPSLLAWGLTGFLFALSAVLFGIFQETPLMSTLYRLAFGGAVIAFTAFLQRSATKGEPPESRKAVLFAVGLGAVFLYPLLDTNVHERDHQRIETFAQEVLRPVDNWFKFVVDEALQQFASDETVDILSKGGAQNVERLAFTRWAKSYACREGYTCAFTVADSAGNELSRFTIGGQTAVLSQVDSTIEALPVKSIKVKAIGTGISALNIYAGTTPIQSPGGRLLGYGRVVIAAGQQTLFRGENPAILRGATQESIESFYRPVMISEFRDGVLLTTGNNSLPVGYELPAEVRAALSDPTRTTYWSDEIIDDAHYETLFVRRDAAGGDVVALSLAELSLTWHLIGIVKILIYFGMVSLTLFLVYLCVQWLRGVRHTMTFRGRLLIALLVTAIVPLALIALYGRYAGRQRLMDNASQRLSEETAMIASNILDQPGNGAGPGLSVSPVAAEDIAADVGTDFNLYVGNALAVSSRPELFEAGILDHRMSGSAYANVNIKGKRFYVETESIGRYDYAVGYRPVIDSAGTIAGVVSVPTLYRLDEVEMDLARRNAFLVGVYSLVLLAIVAIATVFANRIAAPIQRLTEATKRVSRGELDVTLHLEGADEEIGELARAFELMTRNLKQSREELIRYERELAWKEMAKQVAHEIKNPLTPIRLSIQHLRQTYKDNVADFHAVLEQVTKTVIEQIDTLSRIASEFSHFARMPKRQIEPCDVNGVLAESVQLFERDLKVQFERSLAANLPLIQADREELRRAFINVLRNAIQAMNNVGRVVIRTQYVDKAVAITIRDFGQGIPEEMRDRLFQPNFSTKTDGMGLGLAIVKKTIDDLGGRISIESVRGEGTTVSITLPIAGPDAAPAA